MLTLLFKPFFFHTLYIHVDSSSSSIWPCFQGKLDSLQAEQPAVEKPSGTSSLTWRGITYSVRNQRVQANLQQVADLSQQQQERMQTDQAPHEAGQNDGLIAALNDTKASLGSILKAAPGTNTIHATLAVILILTESQSTIMLTSKLSFNSLLRLSIVCAPISSQGQCIIMFDECLAFYLFCAVWPVLQVHLHIVRDAHHSNLGAKA